MFPAFGKSRRPPPPFGWHPFKSVWFWIFACGSLALFVFGLQESLKGWRSGRWPQVPCEIIRSEAETLSNGRFRFFISYRYEIAGQSHVSNARMAKSEYNHGEFEPVQELLVKYPRGLKTICHVNPANPDEAVLESGSDYVLLVISSFPMVIWALIERVALADWWQRRRQTNPKFDPGPISANRALKRLNRRTLYIGLLALTIFVVFAFVIWLQPFRELRRTSHWHRTPCTVISSEVTTETHHQGQSFHPLVVYAYTVGGREYRSSRVDFAFGLDLSYSDAERIVREHPPGQKTFCYVDPANPVEAVLQRTVRVSWFFGIFSLVIIAISGFLIFHSLMEMRKGNRRGRHFTGLPARELVLADSKILRADIPAQLLLAGFVAMGIGCTVLAALLLANTIPSLLRGHIEIVQLLYGCGGVGGVIYAMKKGWQYAPSAMNPPPQLRLTPGALTLGRAADVEWTFPRANLNLRRLTLLLEGREEVRVIAQVSTPHGPSKDEKTEKVVFAQLPIIELEQGAMVGSGTAKIVAPAQTMHSFEACKHKIIWSLKVEAETRAGGRIEHRFKVVVRPDPELKK